MVRFEKAEDDAKDTAPFDKPHSPGLTFLGVVGVIDVRFVALVSWHGEECRGGLDRYDAVNDTLESVMK